MKRLTLTLSFISTIFLFAGCKTDAPKEIPAYNQLEYKKNIDLTKPRQVCDSFIVNLFHAPEQAFQLYSRYNDGVSVEQFVEFRNMLLPAGNNITSIEFAKVEHGFTNTPSGLQSSEYTYKVKSTDNLKPRIKLEIDVVKEENIYHILRYGVMSE